MPPYMYMYSHADTPFEFPLAILGVLPMRRYNSSLVSVSYKISVSGSRAWGSVDFEKGSVESTHKVPTSHVGCALC